MRWEGNNLIDKTINKMEELIKELKFWEMNHKLTSLDREDLRTIINKIEKQLTLTDVSSMFSAEQMEKAYNDGVEAEQQRCGDFDIENYC